MNERTKINLINEVLEEYISDPSNQRKVQAKEMMPAFIKKGIFNGNHKDGLPIRTLLRKLYKEENLKAIPYAYGEEKKKNINWFFTDLNLMTQVKVVSSSSIHSTEKKNCSISDRVGRKNSDEYYVVGLCNEVLRLTASQQHKFNFLLGDTGRKLPVDAYYEELNLVVEYCESQHSNSTPFFDNKITASGVSRGVQRRIYDERRKIELPKHGIKLIEIHYDDFGTTKRIKRNHDKDIEVVKKKLADFV